MENGICCESSNNKIIISSPKGIIYFSLDKGTYDAIALAEKSEDGASLVSRYPPRVSEALKPGGMFLITCKDVFGWSTPIRLSLKF